MNAHSPPGEFLPYFAAHAGRVSIASGHILPRNPKYQMPARACGPDASIPHEPHPTGRGIEALQAACFSRRLRCFMQIDARAAFAAVLSISWSALSH
jgi:hypothetical protein